MEGVLHNASRERGFVKISGLGLLNYAMSRVKLPEKLCNELNATMAKFWWGSIGSDKIIHWFSWDKLSDKMHHGGLGFKDLRCFNPSHVGQTDGASSVMGG